MSAPDQFAAHWKPIKRRFKAKLMLNLRQQNTIPIGINKPLSTGAMVHQMGLRKVNSSNSF